MKITIRYDGAGNFVEKLKNGDWCFCHHDEICQWMFPIWPMNQPNLSSNLTTLPGYQGLLMNDFLRIDIPYNPITSLRSK